MDLSEIRDGTFLESMSVRVPFLQLRTDITAAEISAWVGRCRDFYAENGKGVSDDELQTVLDLFNLPGAQPKAETTLGEENVVSA